MLGHGVVQLHDAGFLVYAIGQASHLKTITPSSSPYILGIVGTNYKGCNSRPYRRRLEEKRRALETTQRTRHHWLWMGKCVENCVFQTMESWL